MTDTHPDKTQELEDEILLDKLDSMLRKHRREYSSIMRATEQAAPSQPDAEDGVFPESSLDEREVVSSSGVDEIPILTEKVTISIDNWPAQTDISELLCFAFDAAVRETQISLNPSERLTLLQALAKRLPKNF
jgi:hypothetical protein